MARTLLAPLLCGVMVALAAFVPARAAGRSDEVRALWVRRASLESADAIRRMVASASTAGFNALFVQAMDDAAVAAAAFDPLGETIAQAHAAGLRVHAWVDVARVAAPGELPFARDHIVYRHPEWLMVPRALAAELLAIDAHSPDYLGRLARWTRTNADRIDGLYISPVQPEAASHVAGVLRDLARRYALDGVYLDHVQFPTADFDFGAKSVAAFRSFMRGELPLAERQRIDDIEEIDPFAYPNELPDQWRLFRQSQLTALIARLRTTVKEARPAALV
ncbi:MAG TPA: family 10 glycosylhydrolase, partial [Vicinamibacterales bacterium]